MSEPALRLLSLGAGVQSSATLILSARGDLPKLDGAIFADTGWEPPRVYAHLQRLMREVAEPAGIPVYQVAAGNIRADALDSESRFATMPLFIRNPDGTEGMARRQCTGDYKVKPIKRKIRELLGHPHPEPVPKGLYVEQWIGISTDERGRAMEVDPDAPEGTRRLRLKVGDARYARNRYPLLELGMSREQCEVLLAGTGFDGTPKSACVGCPYHSNRQWRDMRDNHPDEWADAVEFDESVRHGSARATAQGQDLIGNAYLHRARVALPLAPIDHVTSAEWRSRQTDILHMLAVDEFEESLSDEEDRELGGCSPFSCHGEDVEDDDEE